jgi:AraC family transcriptional activator of pobA
LYFSIIRATRAVLMLQRREIRKYGLYGEGKGLSSPEFVHIETISSRSSLHNWSIAPHIHPNIFQLLYLHKGRGILSVDNAEMVLAPPVLVIVPCGCVHAFRFKPQTEGWVLSIADLLVDDPRLASVDVSATVRGDEVLRLPLSADQEQEGLLVPLLEELLRRHNAAPGLLSSSLVSIVGLILNLADEHAQAGSSGGSGPLDRRISLFRRFNKLVERNLRLQWPVERYAAELGTTAPTLTRTCREIAGIPPAQLILDRRLREAKRALSFTDASVSMISDDLGFSDPAYFARVFKQHTGTTASAYRKERFWAANRAK